MAYLDLELQESPERRREYEECLRLHSSGIRKGVEFLLRAIQLMHSGTQPDDKRQSNAVVFMLARHVAEEVDAVSVLVDSGCVVPCKSHLRSAFEAAISVEYMLKADTERRALAYLVKNAVDRLRFYDKCDSRTPAGAKLRAEIQDDDIGRGILESLREIDFDVEKARLDAMLAKPPRDAVYAEWQRLKKGKRHPTWHALFGGPQSIRELAHHVNRGFWYEFMYSDWSGQLHAGHSFHNVGKTASDPLGRQTAIRPLRHPDGIKDVYRFAQGMAIELGNLIKDQYLSHFGGEVLRDMYVKEIKPLNEKVESTKLAVPWR